MPTRVRMTRQRPWRHEHPDAVIVARPSRWGNPYRPVRLPDGSWVAEDVNGVQYPGHGPVAPGTWYLREDALRDCIRLFIQNEVEYELGTFTRADVHTHLHGRDLACWCPLDQPCHGDVLLDLANGSRS